MRRTKHRLIISGLILLFVQLIYAQENRQYLYQGGLVDSLYSSVLNETREIYIQLPSGYQPDAPRTYPVVFLLDGDVLLPALTTVHAFYSGGFIPEMVLIGISNSTNRTRDLTPSRVTSRRGMSFNDDSGGADNFMEFIEDELIPFVESKYPVTTYRTLIGHSYGGLFVINALLSHKSVFANYLAIDPSLDWDGQKMLVQAQRELKSADYSGKSLFMSLSGQLHMQDPTVTIDNVMRDSSEYTLFARSNIAFSDLIDAHKQNGMNLEWRFYPGDLHGTIPLPSIMDGLISLFTWFQMEHTDKFNSPETPAHILREIVKYRADKLQSHFNYRDAPYPEDLFNMLGYMNMDMGHRDKAKMFFEMAIEYYPDSANAYDSMADYYERQKDFVNALKYVSKAYDLSGEDYFKERMEGLKEKTR